MYKVTIEVETGFCFEEIMAYFRKLEYKAWKKGYKKKENSYR